MLEDDESLDDDELLDDVLPLVELAVLLELSVPLDKRISIVTLPVPPAPPLLLAPKPPPGGGPPAPPGPLAKALEKRFCNSLAWLLVSEPFWTCCWIKLSRVDCMSDGEGGPEEDEASLCNSLLMLLSAELKALSSDELMVPLDTSDVSSFCSMLKGENDCPETDEIDMGRSSMQRGVSRTRL